MQILDIILKYLRTLGKYYIAVIGLRNYLLGYRDRDTGHTLENIVYFELLRCGYDVAIGKFDNTEVDFIAIYKSLKILRNTVLFSLLPYSVPFKIIAKNAFAIL